MIKFVTLQNGRSSTYMNNAAETNKIQSLSCLGDGILCRLLIMLLKLIKAYDLVVASMLQMLGIMVCISNQLNYHIKYRSVFIFSKITFVATLHIR